MINIRIKELFPVVDVLLTPLNPLHAGDDVFLISSDEDKVNTRHELVDKKVGIKSSWVLTNDVGTLVMRVKLIVLNNNSVEVMCKDMSSDCCTASLWPCNNDWTVHGRLYLNKKREAFLGLVEASPCVYESVVVATLTAVVLVNFLHVRFLVGILRTIDLGLGFVARVLTEVVLKII